jgi:hypothetical protein
LLLLVVVLLQLLLPVVREGFGSRGPERRRLREAKVHQAAAARSHVEQKVARLYVAATKGKKGKEEN